MKNPSNEIDDSVWREKLTPEEFHVCREKGTERPFTGEYWDCKDHGVYHCRCCGESLFLSDSKYDSRETGFEPATSTLARLRSTN